MPEPKTVANARATLAVLIYGGATTSFGLLLAAAAKNPSVTTAIAFASLVGAMLAVCCLLVPLCGDPAKPPDRSTLISIWAWLFAGAMLSLFTLWILN